MRALVEYVAAPYMRSPVGENMIGLKTVTPKSLPLHGSKLSTLLGLQPRFGNKLLGIRVVSPQNGAAVLKGLTVTSWVAKL